MAIKYQLPFFLEGTVSQQEYAKWLTRKANTHLKRDRNRGNVTATRLAYKEAIHIAVHGSKGSDAYTGEMLDWSLLSIYDNDDSKRLGREYKKSLALLPTIDHVGDGLGPADFKICGWRTNDAKNDLSYQEFLSVCKAVVVHEEAQDK